MRLVTQLKQEIRRNVGYRLSKLREALKLSKNEMAEKLDRSPGAYKRNENGETFPEYSVLYNMAKKFDVSIDWLLCEKGPMFYSEKEDSMIQLEKDYKELISHMQKDSILRYEILLIFRKYLEGKNHSEN